jgi:hypothetical protein
LERVQPKRIIITRKAIEAAIVQFDFIGFREPKAAQSTFSQSSLKLSSTAIH